MSQHNEPAPGPGDPGPPPGGRVAFERLRERTDELELIISGLLAFALLTVPGRIFDSWASSAMHVEGVLDHALRFGFIVSVGLCYSLAFAFISHLAIRGYWVGLIGLKSTFPDGIRWDRIPLMGTVSRSYYQRVVGDLGAAIDRTDRAASILFAMTILVALMMVWIGVIAIVVITAAGLVGSLFDDGERATWILLIGAYVLFTLVGLMPIVLERLLARRQRAGHPSPGLHRVLLALFRAVGFMIPQRLISPVQLTLQSNLNGRGFMVVYFAVLMLAMMFGALHVVGSVRFAMFHRYDVITTEAVEHGMVSAHYEALRSGHDQLLRYPMIPSDRIADTHLRLFLPHQPRRDNALARATCSALPDGVNAASGPDAAAQAHACVSSFWTVTLDGTAVALDDFVPAERRDLGMRGLIGYIPVATLAPGRHDLHVVWNAGGDDEGDLRKRESRIPFWFTPGIEQGVATE